MAKRTIRRLAGTTLRRGQTVDLQLKVSESYTGDPIRLPLRVIRATKPGPAVFITAAVHGDELNGMGIIHELMFGEHLNLQAGMVILVPVVNIFGFDAQSRYMPDRRDLNRAFPGTPGGSLTSRLAHIVFREILTRCDYGIDLHSAAAPRINYPNIRGDMSAPQVRRLAKAFGAELLIDGKGPIGSLRREATRAGCPTIVLEAGEPSKIEPSVLHVGVRGVRNVLMDLGMVSGKPIRPAYQTRVRRSMWVRSEVGGILRYHVSPGDLIEAGQPLATNVTVFGREQSVLVSPINGIILGMTTLPMVKPGEPVCHLAVPGRSVKSMRRAIEGAASGKAQRRLMSDLASNFTVTEHEADWRPNVAPEEPDPDGVAAR